MNTKEIEVVQHALKNGNRFYTESNDKVWTGLVEKGFAIKRGGWTEDMSYFIVTGEGKEVFKQTLVPVK